MTHPDQNADATRALWGGRFSEPTDAFVQRFTASEAFDRRLAIYDIQGSRAHADMLANVGVLTAQECSLIHQGLDQVMTEISEQRFDWRVAREDVHMNLSKLD